MLKQGKSQEYLAYLLLVGYSSIAFILITRGKILDPTFIGWVIQGPGNYFDDFIGWEFFRYTPLLQNPLGLNSLLGINLNNTIVYTNTLPLFALPFKLLNPFLPIHFQYVGLWVLLCFILQALFAWRLLVHITQNSWLRFLAVGFFIVAPPMLWRLHGHEMLFAHWTLLLGLYLYFDQRFRAILWILLLSLSALISGYFLFMLIVLWGADLLQRFLLDRKIRINQIILTLSILLFVLWQAGYFTISTSIFDTNGFGLYRLNLLGLFNPLDKDSPTGSWSWFLPMLPAGAGDYEGFNYLGLGMIILFFTSMGLLIKNRNQLTFSWRVLPLTGAFVFLTLYALSNNIALGAHELFHYPFSGSGLFGFRASGRMFWPVYYGIYLGALYGVIRFCKPGLAGILIGLCLMIQVLDTFPGMKQFRELSRIPEYHSPFKSDFWRSAARKYKNILYVTPFAMLTPSELPTYIHLAYYASLNHLGLNTVLAGRIDEKKVNQNYQTMIQSLKTNRLDPEALYVFDQRMASLMPKKIAHQYAGIVDGFLVLAP